MFGAASAAQIGVIRPPTLIHWRNVGGSVRSERRARTPAN
jgi:hypothetical protein